MMEHQMIIIPPQIKIFSQQRTKTRSSSRKPIKAAPLRRTKLKISLMEDDISPLLVHCKIKKTRAQAKETPLKISQS